MSIALSEFWTRLVRSGICDAEDCRKVASAFATANSGTPPSDPESVARFMIKRGKLTRFQARSLLVTPPRELRAGSYLIRTDETPPPLSRWLEASRISDGRVGMLMPWRISEPDADLVATLNRQQAVDCDSLQPLEFELHDRSALMFAPLPEGECLIVKLADHRAWSRGDVCRIGISLAEALAKLHQHSLVHGQVRADRVWIGNNGDGMLLRDPFAAECVGRAVPMFLDDLDASASYAAPELQTAGQAPTVSSDIYGLGCLLFRLAAGRLPFEGSSDPEIRAQHLSQSPPELAEAVQRGEAGDPLFRVLAFAMAKLPTARFGSAEQLANALRATASMVQSHDSAGKIRRDGPEAVPLDAPPLVVATSDETSAKGVAKPASRKEPERAAKEASGNRSAIKGLPPGGATSEKITTPYRPMSVDPGNSTTDRGTATTDRGKDAPLLSPGSEAEALVSSIDKPAAQVTHETPSLESIEGAERKTPPAGDATKPPVAAADRLEIAQPPLPAEPPLPVEPPAPAEPPPRSAAPRRRRKKQSKAPLVLGALCVAVLMLIIGLIASDGNEDESGPPTRRIRSVPGTIPPVSNQRRPPESATASDPMPGSIGGYTVVEDDRLLFIPPYPADSPPPPLELLPPGPAVIASLRLAEILQDATTSQLLNRVAPEMRQLAEIAAQRAQVSSESIRRLTVALYPGREGWPEVSLVVELEASVTAEDLIARLGVAAARTPEGATIYVGEQDESDAYFWVASPDASVDRYAIGSLDRISEVAANEGGSIPLPTVLQALWESASSDADLTVLFPPNFLFADGRAMLESSAPALMGPLKQLMQPDVASALISLDWCDQELAYLEARFAPSGGISQPALMQKIMRAVESWPQWAEQFMLDSVPDASWRLLALRLPSMMRFVTSQARFDVSAGVVVANAYVPSQAFPQVTMATLLAMNTPLSSPSEAKGSEVPQALSIEELLDREMAVSFDQESLEFALEAIISAFNQTLPAGSTMPPARIIGGDLELMGITQNQQVRDFSKVNLPLRTVLTDLVLGANPDKSATGPSDPRQSLIWVVAEDPSVAGGKALFITTRQAAATKQYALPREFQDESNRGQ